MKKPLILCVLILSLLLFFFAKHTQARYIWEELVKPQPPTGWQTHFNDVHALPGIGQAWAVGDRGVIAHTTDGGVTWTAQTSGTANNLLGVYFASSDDGWSVGEDGIILVTSDGGDSWTAISGITSQKLYSVHFPTTDEGWAVGNGGVIYYSDDGGYSWSSQTSTTTSNLYGVFFSDASTGWAVGERSTILHTTDGSTWTAQTSGLTTNIDLRDVDFNAAGTIGLIAGEKGTILRSTDSGASWGAVTSDTDQYLYSVDFFDGAVNSAWIAGGQTYDPGIIMRSTDNGLNWASQVPVMTNRYRQMLGISFNSFFEGIAVGRYGVILRTTNGTDPAPTWSQVSETAANLHGLSSPDNTNAWACGSMGTMIRTTDRWDTWVEQDTDAYTELNAVSFPNQWYGWAVGNGRKPYQDVVSGEPATVIRTANGGGSWASQSLGATIDENMYDVFMLDTNNGWTCGQWGSVFYTGNGGSLWTLQDTDNDAYDQNNALLGIHFVALSEGWACGYDGLMVHTTNGGTQWTAQATNVDTHLYDVFMLDANNGWAVGEEDTVIKTTDGGATWVNPQFGGGATTLQGVDFSDLQYGLAVGTEGSAYRGTNAGWCWDYQPVDISYDVYDVLMIDSMNAWASAGWGEVLQYTDVSDSPPVAVFKGQGAGFSDLNLYQYWSPAPGDWVYWDAEARNPSPYYFARDLWTIPSGNDVVSAAPLDIDGDGIDEIAVVKNQGGDHNLYIYNALQYGDKTYWDSFARNPSPVARDLWFICGGNNTVAIAGVDGNDDGIDEVAVLKHEGGRQKLYYYNAPAPGEYYWAQAFARNGLGPYAFDEWYVPAHNNLFALAGADGVGGGKDQLLTIENARGDYGLYVWKAPDLGGKYLTEFYNRYLQTGFTTPDDPIGFGKPQAMDLWIVPQRNDIVTITGLTADDENGVYPGTYDALGVMENNSGDWNLYLWKIPVKPEHTYTEAQVRQIGVGGLGNPQGRDYWIIPGNGRSPWIVGLEYP